MKSLSTLRIRRVMAICIIIVIQSLALSAQTPVLKVDLNIGSRQEAEVNEPGYTPWPIYSSIDSITLEGVKIAFKNGSVAAAWYKAGVQSPYYARLANDGLATNDIEMHISGLKAGKHSLVTFHNTVDSPDGNIFSPIDIYKDDSLVVDDLEPSNRVLSNYNATSFFYEFDVKDSETVVFRFKTDVKEDGASDKLIINGFHINASDPKRMAKSPYPDDLEEHVDIDNDTLVLQWEAPDNTLYQNIYFGTDYEAVDSADSNSPLLKSSQVDTFLTVTNFYSMNEYYWRVDVIDSANRTTKGDIWYFKKRSTAFPGAEGYGRYAIGGRGGKVIYVTNLNDSGPGSFREAVENDSVPRTILFAVSGLITLESRLVINDQFVTVAGQTAPGKGVCFRWAPIGVTGDDLIVQNLRVRIGEGVTYDGMGLTGANNSIIDHCSISWTIDEAFSSRSAEHITLQNTLISEALNSANHENYASGTEHGYAASISGDIGSFHHNLLAHCYGRNWSLAGGLDGDGYYEGCLDIFNNVVYNWGNRATDGGAHEVNFVNNYYKPGESTTMFYALNAQYDNYPGTQQYYFDGNIMPGYFDESNQTAGRKYTGTPQGYSPWVDEPFFESDATVQSATQAYKTVLSDVGCTQPVFDDHDIRIVNETLNGTYTYIGSKTGKEGFPDSEDDVGGWEVYPGYIRDTNWDTDLDGLPNWWETALGLNTNSVVGTFTETNADEDKNGYTNLEEYLQWMAAPHYFSENMETVNIDLSSLTVGFTNDPKYTVSSTLNGISSIVEGSSVAQFTPNKTGLAGFNFKVTDAEGDSMSKDIGLYFGTMAADSAFEYTYLLDRPNSDTTTTDTTTTDTTVITDTTQTWIENIDLHDVVLFPNPAGNSTQLTLYSAQEGDATISIFTITGEAILTQKEKLAVSSNTIYLDINSLKPGIYFVNIRSANWQSNIKLIKNNNNQ